MKEFLNWEKISKILVFISLLLNLFLTYTVLSMLGDVKDELHTNTIRSIKQGSNGRYQAIEKPHYSGSSSIIIVDTQTGESWKQ